MYHLYSEVPSLDHNILCGRAMEVLLLISAFEKQLPAVHLPGMQLADTGFGILIIFWAEAIVFLRSPQPVTGHGKVLVLGHSAQWHLLEPGIYALSSLVEWPKLCWISIMIRGSCWIWLPQGSFSCTGIRMVSQSEGFPAHLPCFKLRTFPHLLPWPHKPLELHSTPASTFRGCNWTAAS